MSKGIKIARFVGIEACKSIFSEKSTFVLRSPWYYRRLYEQTDRQDAKADRNEGCATTPDGGSADFTDFLASCWTVLQGGCPTHNAWSIFEKDEQNIVAIVTTPKLVCDFLNRSLCVEGARPQWRFPFCWLKHQRVCYKPRDVDHSNIADVVPFRKEPRFSRENEYRFALYYAWAHSMDTFIFCAGLGYMESSDGGGLMNFANPEMSQDKKRALREILGNACAGYGDFSDMTLGQVIANANVLDL